jgi:hypothetical protein
VLPPTFTFAFFSPAKPYLDIVVLIFLIIAVDSDPVEYGTFGPGQVQIRKNPSRSDRLT